MATLYNRIIYKKRRHDATHVRHRWRYHNRCLYE